jgi:uncharacterized repeat protein (TIGR03843 family)
VKQEPSVDIHRFPDLDDGRAIEVLAAGEVEVLGRMPWSSNATFLVTVTLGDDAAHAIYKPVRGERPLWDFPHGLARREVAAYVLSEHLGWHLVPETLLRQDAPLGEGSLQRFVWGDAQQHYFTMLEHEDLHPRFRQLAAFDIVANNTDRKSGHCLLRDDGTVWAIDNGLCFSVEPKLRTVIWEFGGDPLPRSWRDDLSRFVEEDLPEPLTRLLDEDELAATVRRARALAKKGCLPQIPEDRRPYPWPLV